MKNFSRTTIFVLSLTGPRFLNSNLFVWIQYLFSPFPFKDISCFFCHKFTNKQMTSNNNTTTTQQPRNGVHMAQKSVIFLRAIHMIQKRCDISGSISQKSGRGYRFLDSHNFGIYVKIKSFCKQPKKIWIGMKIYGSLFPIVNSIPTVGNFLLFSKVL